MDKEVNNEKVDSKDERVVDPWTAILFGRRPRSRQDSKNEEQDNTEKD